MKQTRAAVAVVYKEFVRDSENKRILRDKFKSGGTPSKLFNYIINVMRTQSPKYTYKCLYSAAAHVMEDVGMSLGYTWAEGLPAALEVVLRGILSNSHCDRKKAAEDYLSSLEHPINYINPCSETYLTPLGEEPMQQIDIISSRYAKQNIAQVTLVNGQDASVMNEEDFFSRIHTLQKELTGLGELPESTYVNSRIAGITKDINDLVSLMDDTLKA